MHHGEEGAALLKANDYALSIASPGLEWFCRPLNSENPVTLGRQKVRLTCQVDAATPTGPDLRLRRSCHRAKVHLNNS